MAALVFILDKAFASYLISLSTYYNHSGRTLSLIRLCKSPIGQRKGSLCNAVRVPLAVERQIAHSVTNAELVSQVKDKDSLAISLAPSLHLTAFSLTLRL